jgi:hypothetical protein
MAPVHPDPRNQPCEVKELINICYPGNFVIACRIVSVYELKLWRVLK